MSIRLSQGYLRSTEASCFVNLCFLAFGSSKKDDPCNKPSLSSSFVVQRFKLCVTSHNTFMKTLCHQFLNLTEQKLDRQLTRLFFPSACEK